MGAPEITEWLTRACHSIVLVYAPSLELYTHAKLSFVLRTAIDQPEAGLLLTLLRGDRVVGEAQLPPLAGASLRIHDEMTELELYAQGGALCARVLVDRVYEGLVPPASVEWN